MTTPAQLALAAVQQGRPRRVTGRRRGAQPRPAPSFAVLPCVVLGVDPGATSGWAVLTPEGRYASGAVVSTHASRVNVVNDAIHVAYESGLPLVVIAEKWAVAWRPGGAPRESWGQWLAALDECRVPRRRIVRVNVGRWSAKLLGSMALTTEQRQTRSVAAVRARFGIRVEHDEAAAILIALYGSRAGEVLAVLPKRRAKT